MGRGKTKRSLWNAIPRKEKRIVKKNPWAKNCIPV